MEKGRMRKVKKATGIMLAIFVINYIHQFSFVDNLLKNYPYILYIFVGIAKPS